MRHSVAIFFILFAVNLQAQKFADKNYYLVDSLIYENISPEYQYLIETNLKTYHAAKTDMERVTAVNQIVKLCWDENVWPKYNEWIYTYTTEKLKEPQSDTVRFQLLQALAGSIYYIGWQYGVQSDYEKCIYYYNQCADIYLEIDDQIGYANALDNIGGTYLIQGESAKALDYHTKALLIREKIDNKLGIGASHLSIGTIYMEHGDYLSAIEEFKEATKYYEVTRFTAGVSSVLNNLGTIQFYLGDIEKAQYYYNQSLEIKIQLEDKQGIAHSLVQLGNLRMINGDFKGAAEYFEKSFLLYSEIGDKRGIASLYNNFGGLYRSQGKFKKAINYYNQSYSLSTETGASLEKRNSLEGLFFTHLMQGEYALAENEILEIIAMRLYDVNVNFEILPEQKKEIYLNTMALDFMNLYSFADVRKNSNPSITETAYNNTLKLKGLLLKSSTAMRDAIIQSGQPEMIEKYTRWIDLKTEISQQYAAGMETNELDVKANEIEKELIKNSMEFSEFKMYQQITWRDVQSKLGTDEAAIEFICFPSQIGNPDTSMRYAALVITPKCQFPKMIDLCTSVELENILKTNQPNNLNYVKEIYGTAQVPNYNLYKLIWFPLEQEFSAVKSIYFSPTGLLHKISFAALRSENNEYLCNRYNLIQLSSTAQLADLSISEFSPDASFSLFGGVKYSTEKTKQVIWNYLPGSLAEIDSIRSMLENHLKINYFSQENASEENFKKNAAQSSFLHIATHGFFYPDPELIQKETYKEESTQELDFRGGGTSYGIWNIVSNKNPLMRSGIALAGANDMWNRDIYAEGEDGVLTAQEVTTLNLRKTDLVVLSACETGLGDIKGNEGVYGLQRAFKMAGVKNLIMSLWQVPDEETAEFMIRFYSKLFVLKDIRLAFSETQKEMSEKYDPYFWAAFILIE